MMGLRKLSMYWRKGAAAVFFSTALLAYPTYCAAMDFEQLRLQNAGHLAEVKNQRFLIRMMPKLLKKRPDAFLLLLGEGEDREMLQQLIKDLGLTDSVRMTGNVSNVNEYLSAMDVFAFPSLYEGLPLSIVEVQANGLPCIISDRVPRDVFITDLLTPLSLDDENAWIEAVCSARRRDSKNYCDAVKQSGLDTNTFLEKVYALYEG